MGLKLLASMNSAAVNDERNSVAATKEIKNFSYLLQQNLHVVTSTEN